MHIIQTIGQCRNDHSSEPTEIIEVTVDFTPGSDRYLDSWTFVKAEAVDTRTRHRVNVSDMLYDLLGLEKYLEEQCDLYETYRAQMRPHFWKKAS